MAGPSGPAFLFNFYPRSPCGERHPKPGERHASSQFLSTLSLRRATRKLPIRLPTALHFYPRSPCGERPNGCTTIPDFSYFYPRSPCGERRNADCNYRSGHPISIHALLAESDAGLIFLLLDISLFLSTLSLRRATPPRITPAPSRRNFYPRSPCGERPPQWMTWSHPQHISIHALLAESDGSIR